MPGGNEEAWPYVKDVLQAISAKSDGEPCCQWVGDGMVKEKVVYSKLILQQRALVTMLRWFTMALNTVICSSSAR
jgi:6-phosphogluconate dehydrogenase